jgi:hypothetical protein
MAGQSRVQKEPAYLVLESYESGPDGGGLVQHHFALAPGSPLRGIALDVERRRLCHIDEILAEARAARARVIAYDEAGQSLGWVKL